MDLLVRRNALLAAAKVSLALSVVACGAATEQTNPDDSLGGYLSGNKDSGADSGNKDSGADADDCSSNTPPTNKCGVAPNFSPDAGAPNVSSDSRACCTALVRSALTDAGAGWMMLPEGDKDVDACCNAVVAVAVTQPWNRDEWLPNAPPFDVVQSCCTLTGAQNVACTPWGPPAPPSMTKVRRAELVALFLADTMAEVA